MKRGFAGGETGPECFRASFNKVKKGSISSHFSEVFISFWWFRGLLTKSKKLLETTDDSAPVLCALCVCVCVCESCLTLVFLPAQVG